MAITKKVKESKKKDKIKKKAIVNIKIIK